MSKVILRKDGLIQLPKDFLQKHALKPGMELVFEPEEHRLSLYYTHPNLEKAYIEVTSACNLNCDMCVRQVWQGELGSMSMDTFQNVLEGLRGFPDLRRVVFGGYGEPLMHPHLVDMIAQVHSLGAGITLITNGVLLSRNLAEELFRAGVDTLVVSLDSLHRQAYQAEGLDQVLENLFCVSELMSDCGWRLPTLGIEFVATQSNLNELDQLPKLARQLGASIVIVNNLLPHSRQMEQEVLYERDKPLQLGGGWGIRRSGWIAWGAPRLPRMKLGTSRKCPFINDISLTIGWDGAVSPCSALMHSYPYYLFGRKKEVSRYVLGYAGEQSLSDIWTSEEYVTFRAKVEEFRFPSCIDCGMDCTYAQENNDCFGNTPSCSDCLWAHGVLHCP